MYIYRLSACHAAARYFCKNIVVPIRPRMEKSDSCWPRTADVQ